MEQVGLLLTKAFRGGLKGGCGMLDQRIKLT